MKKHITVEAIEKYAAVSKDKAAIHLDVDAARAAGFDQPLVHGIYVMGLAQSLFMEGHPKQWITAYKMKFQKPLLVDTIAVFNFERVKDSVGVTVTKENGDKIAVGTFLVKELQR
ncbi:MaoC family dehydratase [Psychrobacillus sp. NPDC096389]|uniref:MaoC family dehydratase n=1 Tax=Psychrobacillus sp. NPDC096389 TaxID=3364490 RepID=UPI003810B5A7